MICNGGVGTARTAQLVTTLYEKYVGVKVVGKVAINDNLATSMGLLLTIRDDWARKLFIFFLFAYVSLQQVDVLRAYRAGLLRSCAASYIPVFTRRVCSQVSLMISITTATSSLTGCPACSVGG
jgi:hypothetical protein